MSQFWEKIAAGSSEYEAEDFESVAYRLIAEQTLYYSDRNSRMAYGLVERFEREFKTVLAQVGIDLLVNRSLRYACALPRVSRLPTATTAQTLLALVLRKIYDEYARIGQLSDDGEVICDLVELEEVYRLSTQRELPSKGELDALVRTLRRWGLVRKVDDQGGDSEADLEGQPYAIAIRPSIVDLLGETAIQRLLRWGPADENADAQRSQGEESESEGVAA